jgi:hypothetical protein
MTELVEYSDYLVFVDESGDHHLTRIDPQFPVFVLLFAILRKDDYVEKVCPALSRFKFQFWGHDEVARRGGVARARHPQTLRRLSVPTLETIEGTFSRPVERTDGGLACHCGRRGDRQAVFRLSIHCARQPLRLRHGTGVGAYPPTLGHPGAASASDRHHGREARSSRGYADLEFAFRRVCDGANALNQRLPFDLVMIPKTSNSAGLQLTDLMARPVALHHLRPDQPNRAFEIIQTKFRRSPAGQYEGWGLKRLP